MNNFFIIEHIKGSVFLALINGLSGWMNKDFWSPRVFVYRGLTVCVFSLWGGVLFVLFLAYFGIVDYFVRNVYFPVSLIGVV